MRDKTRWAIEQMAEIHYELDKDLKGRDVTEGVHASFEIQPFTLFAHLTYMNKMSELKLRDALDPKHAKAKAAIDELDAALAEAQREGKATPRAEAAVANAAAEFAAEKPKRRRKKK